MELENVEQTLSLAGNHNERVTFPNGRGVSIIRNAYSYGGRSGLFEVAVLDSTGELDYSTPVTNDVLGWLTPTEVFDTMVKVRDLPRN